jgi:predicted DCC family thiol-disulfide oxidoreductase YuxK
VNTVATAFPLTIFYDASCPLCRKEMYALKEYDAQNRLHLVDCSIDGFQDRLAQQANISRADMMKLIHARDANGQWLIGVDVFIEAYRAAGIEAVAKFFEFRATRPFLNRLYPWIARNRMLLSRLGVTDTFEFFVKRAARRAQIKAMSCNEEKCDGVKTQNQKGNTE